MRDSIKDSMKNSMKDSMKAVVMETKNGSSVILREDGIFEKVNQTYEVGQTIEWNASLSAHRKPKYSTIYRYAGAAACFAAVVTAGLGATYQTAFACSYVSVDINPSIEFTLNRMNRVLSVTGLNDDAQTIVDELNELGIRFDTLETALDKTQTVLQEQHYLTDSDTILIDISSDDPKRLSTLTQKVEYSMNPSESSERSVEPTLRLTTSSLADRDEAHTNQISTGRYGVMKKEAAQKGTEITPNDIETFRELPVDKLFETDNNTTDAYDRQSPDEQPSSRPGQEPQPSSEQIERPSETNSLAITPQGGNLQDTMPLETVPQEAVPQEATSQEAVPQGTAPQESIPQGATPQESIPQGTTPQESIPQGTAPQESIPQGTTPQESIPQGGTPQGPSTQASSTHQSMQADQVPAQSETIQPKDSVESSVQETLP